MSYKDTLPKSMEELKTLSFDERAKLCQNKYNFVPGTILTRYFKGIKYTILVNDDGSFSYNGDKYSTLSAVATKIAGMKLSGPKFFNLATK